MAAKWKPVGASEIKDPKIVREAIAQVRKERTPEEREAIKVMIKEKIEWLDRMMAR
jgi:hypothetical protein